MRKRIAYTAGLALVMAVILPSAAEAARSKVVIDYYTGSSWVGHVASHKSSCENGRTVTMYRKQEGNDEKIDSEKTHPGKGDSEGVFVIADPSVSEGQTYYAKVKEKGDCDPDKSKDFDYPDDQPF
jgi:hypothetical protein